MNKIAIQRHLASNSVQILISCTLAMLVGYLVNRFITNIPPTVGALVGLPGELWLRALKSIIVPMLLVYMISAMDLLKKLPGGGSKIVRYAMLYFAASTLIALALSILLSIYVMMPNVTPFDLQAPLVDLSEDSIVAETSIFSKIIAILLSTFPENIVRVFASNSALTAAIVIGIVIGVQINGSPDQESTIMKLVKELESIITAIVSFLITVSPIGIFSLILKPLIDTSIEKLASLVGVYLLTIFAGFFIQLLVVYPLIYAVLIHKNPFTYLHTFVPAMLTAMGTSSSAASMPVTIQCADKAGINKEIYQLIVPLGVALNKDGYAINLPIGVLFMAAGLSHHISGIEVVMICITGFLATIGASPIPGSSLLMYMMIMESIGLKMNPMYNLLAATDWLTDRPATILNTIGDCIGLAICQKYGLVDPELNIAEGI